MLFSVLLIKKRREAGMAKPNAFVKISGSLSKKKKEVIEWLKNISKQYFLVICPGGGEQINEAFKARGFKVKFGPLGRITDSLEEKQLARNVLEKNRAMIQDLVDEAGINARVIIPVDEIATVLCHVNGDVKLLAAYNGFDKLFILTEKDRVKKKKLWVKKVAKVFEVIEKGGLDKIEVVGF
jgi:hypothetical protein